MKKCFLTFCLLVPVLFSVAQNFKQSGSKPIIDSTVFKHWFTVGNNRAVSNDGKYLMYSLFNTVETGDIGMVIQSIEGTPWKIDFLGVRDGVFSEDSKLFIFQKKDTLYFLKLGTENIRTVPSVTSYKVPSGDTKQWLAYKLESQELVLIDLSTGNENKFSAVADYYFDIGGKVLLIKTNEKKNNNEVSGLQCLNLSDRSLAKVWLSENPSQNLKNISIDKAGKQVAFIVQEKISDKEENSLWYYKTGLSQAVLKVNNQSKGVDKGLSLSDVIEFSQDGNYIYTFLNRTPEIVPFPGYIKLDIWSYEDTILQSTQLNGGIKIDPESYEAVINLADNAVNRLYKTFGDYIKCRPIEKGDFVVVANNPSGDRFWLKLQDTNWLVSLKDGVRKLLPVKGGTTFSISPDGRFLLYYTNDHHYFSYDLLTEKLLNLSNNLPSELFAYHNEYEHPEKGKSNVSSVTDVTPAVGIAGWMEGNKNVLVYDDYDLWLLDLEGKASPVNVTNGYGRKDKIKFRLIAGQEAVCGMKFKEPILLTAFNSLTKENGFYNIRLNKTKDPELLIMGPYTYYHSNREVMQWMEINEQAKLEPLKAKNKNIWFVMRQRADEAPNYFLTKDFISYKPVTNLYPEKNYNWLNAELVTWKQPDNKISQGVLYRPDNFDSEMKYPVIVVVYQRFSQRLYEYPIPGYSNSFINIPWFVSRGYFVFTVDVHNEIGKRLEAAFISITSGVQSLFNRSYIDSTKIAIIGHSQSGRTIYYTITHTSLFAAALASAGSSNAISAGLSLNGSGYKKNQSRLDLEESAHGASLWEKPETYLANSPVLLAHRVTTPLIIFHGMIDSGVPWEQAVEMFIALRRNNKKVWMLQYDNGNHGALGMDAVDYTKRINQFFDHYLKGEPPPRWMTNGIRAARKGIDKGFELDYSENQP